MIVDFIVFQFHARFIQHLVVKQVSNHLFLSFIGIFADLTLTIDSIKVSVKIIQQYLTLLILTTEI